MSTAGLKPRAGTDTREPRPVPAERNPGSQSPAAPGQPGRRRGMFLATGCTLAWLMSVSVGALVDCGPVLHRVGLACHIIALVLSFGAILIVDWVGLLWLLGKRDIHDTRRLEAAAQPLIWGGLAVLLASGAMIKPDITNPLTQAKLLCVLILMLNGIALAPAMRRLRALPAGTHFRSVAVRLRIRILTALSISQCCWWTAIIVGLVNSTLRRWAGG
ncbi:hypothetical protein ACFQ36_03305 [Arthrobacter sp. GCM10027362]|uniref:hypothetical protein n=1 Tax=Arthrobacter sp. GCM10027362 TaxID=3273379 RepID=UPI0036407E0F